MTAKDLILNNPITLTVAILFAIFLSSAMIIIPIVTIRGILSFINRALLFSAHVVANICNILDNRLADREAQYLEKKRYLESTYEVVFYCENCGESFDERVPKGIEAVDAEAKCPTCGINAESE